MPSNYLTGIAPATSIPGSRYAGMSAAEIIDEMHRNGLTQEGVNRVYELRQLGTAPTLPPGVEGAHRGQGRDVRIIGAAPGAGAAANEFLNTFNQTAVDPFRHYDVGNWLGTAGLIVGGAMAGSAAAGGGLAGGGAGGGSTGGGLGIFSNGGVGGLAGVGGGNAGALAASGGIAGGAGVGGTSGALGGLLGGGSAAGSGGGMAGNWGDWINLGGQLLGSYLQGRGAGNAADASVAGIKAGIGEQARQFDLSRADQAPWLQAGTAALGRLQDPNAFTASPGYNFVRSEGNRGIENSFAASGGAQSGNALRALDQYNQNLASQEYNNWWNQQANLAGLGQSSAQNLAGIGANTAANTSNLLAQQGNARASGIEGQTNAMTGGIGDFLSWYNRRRGG